MLQVSYGAIYSDLFAVHIPGGKKVALSVAKSRGFKYVNEVSTRCKYVCRWGKSMVQLYMSMG